MIGQTIGKMANILSLHGECNCRHEPPFGDLPSTRTSGAQAKFLVWIAVFGSGVLSFPFLSDDKALFEIGPYHSIPQADRTTDFQIHPLGHARFLPETLNVV